MSKSVRPLGKLSNTSKYTFKLADVKTEIALNRALYEKASNDYSKGLLTADEAAMLKLANCEMQCKAIDECLQLLAATDIRQSIQSHAFLDARVQRV